MASVDPQALLSFERLYKQAEQAVVAAAAAEAEAASLRTRCMAAESNVERMAVQIMDLRDALAKIAIDADAEHTCPGDCVPCGIGKYARAALSELRDVVLA